MGTEESEEVGGEAVPKRRARMFAVVYLVAHVLGLLSSVDVVYRGARTSQGTIAWAVALNALPMVAVPRILGPRPKPIPRVRDGSEG